MAAVPIGRYHVGQHVSIMGIGMRSERVSCWQDYAVVTKITSYAVWVRAASADWEPLPECVDIPFTLSTGHRLRHGQRFLTDGEAVDIQTWIEERE